MSKITRMRVAKIDPEGQLRAVLPIVAKMSEVRRMIGAKKVSQQLIANIGGIQVFVCCAQESAGKIWRVKDGLPVRGAALMYGNAGQGAADFPGDVHWLQDNIEFEPEGVDRAINEVGTAPIEGEKSWPN